MSKIRRRSLVRPKSPLPCLYSPRAGMIKPGFRRRERFNRIGDICFHPRNNDLSDQRCHAVRVSGTKAIVTPWKIKKIRAQLSALGVIKVP